jgi:hypothetical protein
MYRRAYYRFRRGQRNSSSESSNQHPRWKRYWPVGVVLAVPLIAAAGNYLSNLFNKRSDEPKYEEETVETTPAVVAPPQVSAETEEVRCSKYFALCGKVVGSTNSNIYRFLLRSRFQQRIRARSLTEPKRFLGFRVSWLLLRRMGSWCLSVGSVMQMLKDWLR